jgi:hypothetical protein
MKEITTEPTEWANRWMDTPVNAICLKERADHGDWEKQPDSVKRKFGRLSTPVVIVGEIKSDAEFDNIIHNHQGEVIVIGHRADAFVWRGTPQEALEMWMVD